MRACEEAEVLLSSILSKVSTIQGRRQERNPISYLSNSQYLIDSRPTNFYTPPIYSAQRTIRHKRMDKETRGTQTDEIPSSSTTFKETSTSPMSSRTSSAKYKAKLAELDNLTGHIIIHKFFTKEDVDLESFIKELTKREPMAKIFNSTLNSVVFSKNGTQEVQEVKTSIELDNNAQFTTNKNDPVKTEEIVENGHEEVKEKENKAENSKKNELCDQEKSVDRNIVKDELGEIGIKEKKIAQLRTQGQISSFSLDKVEDSSAQTPQENHQPPTITEEINEEQSAENENPKAINNAEANTTNKAESKTIDNEEPQNVETKENSKNEPNEDKKEKMEYRILGVGQIVGKSSESREIAEELLLKIEEEIINPQISNLLLNLPSSTSNPESANETHQANQSVQTEKNEKENKIQVPINDQNKDKSKLANQPIQVPKFSYEDADGNKSENEPEGSEGQISSELITIIEPIEAPSSNEPKPETKQPKQDNETENGEAAKCPLEPGAQLPIESVESQPSKSIEPPSNLSDKNENEDVKKLVRSPSFDSGFNTNTNTITDSPETSSTFTPPKTVTSGGSNLLLPPPIAQYENDSMEKEEEMKLVCAEEQEAILVPILYGDSTDNLVLFKSDDDSSIAVDENYDARSESSNVSIQSSRNSNLRNISVQTRKKGMRSGGLMSGSSTASSSAQLIDLEVVSKRSSVIGSSSRRLYLPSSSSSLNVLNLDLSLSAVDELKLNVKMSPGRERRRISIKGPPKEIEGKTEKVKRSLERLEKVVK